MTIVDYQTLETELQKYVYDRTDLQARIPTFVQLAERKIFRKLEHRLNESSVSSTVDANDNEVPIPANYKSTKTLVVNGVPLERISENSFHEKVKQSDAGQEPVEFARVGNVFKMYPPPDSAYEYTIYFFRKFALDSSVPASSNDVLTEMPDLYLYATLMEIAPYLGEDERIETWAGMLSEARDSVNEETSDEEYSGQVNQISQPYGD